MLPQPQKKNIKIEEKENVNKRLQLGIRNICIG
jgi:hypothetical protein